MSQQPEQVRERRLQLSALMDGEADVPSTAQLCAIWRDDADSRQTWHAWHLIGDVLRSDDLASQGRRDAVFVASLRERLRAEPVVVAPQPLIRPSRTPRRAWGAGIAVAAGFAAVMAAVLALNTSAPPAVAPVLAQQEAVPTAPVAAATVMAPPAEPQVLVADGKLIRDARLDRYLAAHKPIGGNPVFAMPSSFGAPRPVDGSGSR